MNNTVEYRRLDLNKIKNRISETISTTDSLKNIVPIDWTDSVLNGNNKVSHIEQKTPML